MYYFLSIFIGVIISVMILFNGELTSFHGVYISTTIIHLIALFFVSIICKVKKVPLLTKKIPFLLYTGGSIGVITIVFNNLAFGKISISAITALSLLGQAITSIIIDNYGFFNMPKQAFQKSKLISLLFMVFGIAYMMSSTVDIVIIPIILSFLTGITVVTSRTVNAGFAQKTSMLASTWYNYFTGLIVSVIMVLIFYKSIEFKPFTFSSNVFIYLGGILGALAVHLSNLSVAKISSFSMTLLLFIGQIFSGIILDIILTHEFSQVNLIGGILVTIGLFIDVWIDKKKNA